MRRILDYAVYLVVRLFICVVQALPVSAGAGVARFLAWLCADVLRVREKIVRENLAHAFPEWGDDQRRRTIRGMWEHLFLLVIEVAHVPRKLHETNWRKYVKLREVRPLVARLLSDRATILVTGHFGNFEVGGYMLGLFGFPSHSVARTLDNPYLHDFLTRFRAATGQFLVPKNGGYDQILEVLGSQGTMAFLADQSAGPKGCFVDFFQRKASTYKAIALLSLEYEAPVCVVYARRTDAPMQFEMAAREPADPLDEANGLQSVRKITQWYTRLLEEGVREAPHQYWWIHKRWKDYGQKKRGAKTPPVDESESNDARKAA